MLLNLFSEFEPFKTSRLVWQDKPAEVKVDPKAGEKAAEKKSDVPAAKPDPAAEKARAEAAAIAAAKEGEKRKAASSASDLEGAQNADSLLAFMTGTGEFNDKQNLKEYPAEKVRETFIKHLDKFLSIFSSIGEVLPTVQLDEKLDETEALRKIVEVLEKQVGPKVNQIRDSIPEGDKDILRPTYFKAFQGGMGGFMVKLRAFAEKHKDWKAMPSSEEIKKQIEEGKILPEEIPFIGMVQAFQVMEKAEKKLEFHSRADVDGALGRNDAAFQEYKHGAGKVTRDEFLAKVPDKKDREIIGWALTSEALPSEMAEVRKALGDTIPTTIEGLHAIEDKLSVREYAAVKAIIDLDKKEADAHPNSPPQEELKLADFFQRFLDRILIMVKEFAKQLGIKDDTTTEVAKDKFSKSPIDENGQFEVLKAVSGKGVDLKTEKVGANATAVAPGTLEEVDTANHTVTIKTDKNAKIIYSGVDPIKVKKRDKIEAGATIGTIKTDTLNFQLRDENGEQRDPRGYFGTYMKQPAAAPVAAPTPTAAPAAPEAAPSGFKSSPLALADSEKLEITKGYEANDKKGIEIKALEDKAVQSIAADGEVLSAENGVIKIKYGDMVVTFGGLKPLDASLKAGTKVSKDQKLGAIDANGILSLSVEKPAGTPIDPTPLLKPYKKEELQPVETAEKTDKPEKSEKVEPAEAQKPSSAPVAVEEKPAEEKETVAGATRPLLIRGKDGIRSPTNEEVIALLQKLLGPQCNPTPEQMGGAQNGFYEDPISGSQWIPEKVRAEFFNSYPDSKAIVIKDEKGNVRAPTDDELARLLEQANTSNVNTTPTADEIATARAGLYRTGKEGENLVEIPQELIKRVLPNAQSNVG